MWYVMVVKDGGGGDRGWWCDDGGDRGCRCWPWLVVLRYDQSFFKLCKFPSDLCMLQGQQFP